VLSFVNDTLIHYRSMVAVFDAKWMDAIVLLLGKYSYADHMVVVQIPKGSGS
jgi:hypothetical protein